VAAKNSRLTWIPSLWMSCNQVQIPIRPTSQPLLLDKAKRVIQLLHWQNQGFSIRKQRLHSWRIPIPNPNHERPFDPIQCATRNLTYQRAAAPQLPASEMMTPALTFSVMLVMKCFKCRSGGITVEFGKLSETSVT